MSDSSPLLNELSGTEISFLVDSGPTSMIFIGSDGEVLDVNRTALELFGYTREEVIGVQASVLLPDLVRTSNLHLLNRCFTEAEGPLPDSETQLVGRDKNGEAIYVEARWMVLARDGSPVAVLSFHDVSVDRKAEETLEQYYHVLDSLDARVCVMDRRGVIEFVNTSWRDLDSRTMWPQCRIGVNYLETWAERQHSETTEVVIGGLYEMIQGKRDRLVSEYQVTGLSGPRWYGLYASAYQGDEAKIVISHVDISALKHTELKLHQANRLLALEANVSTAIQDATSAHEILRASVAWLGAGIEHALAGVWIHEDVHDNLALKFPMGPAQADASSYTRVPVQGESELAVVARTLQPFQSGCIRDHAELHNRAWIEQQGITSYSGHPLVLDDRLVGVLAVYSQHVLSAQEIKVLNSVSERISLALAREQAQRDLRKSESRFRSMIGNVPCAIYRCDAAEGRPVRFISPMIEEISGFAPSIFTAQGRTCFDAWVHPDDVQKVNVQIRRAVAERSSYELEYRLVTAEGDIRMVYDRGCAVEEDGLLDHLDGAILDCTDLKYHENLLARQVMRLRILQEISVIPHQSEEEAILSILEEGCSMFEFGRGLVLDVNPERCQVLYAWPDLVDKSGFGKVDPSIWVDLVKRGVATMVCDLEAEGLSAFASSGWKSLMALPLGFGDEHDMKLLVFTGDGPHGVFERQDGYMAMIMGRMIASLMDRLSARMNLERHIAMLAASNATMVNREMRIIEMKEEVNRMAEQLGEPLPYPPVWQEVTS